MSVSTPAVQRTSPLVGRLVVVVLTTLLAITGVLGTFVPEAAAAANPCATPVVNKVACENTQTGTTAWQVSPDASIEGFATQISTNVGGRVDFKVRTTSTNYRLDVYRLGWYGGAGGRLVSSVSPTWTGTQPDCLRDASTGLVDCGNWRVSASWTIPSTAVSGVYVANLHRLDSSAENQITFVVRDDSSRSDMVFQTSDSTWAAYNTWGGASMYMGDGPGGSGRAYKVSYNRPLGRQEITGQLMYAEYPMIRFLEQNGYDLSYISGVDTDSNGALLRNHQVFMSVGHDEYWSGQQRTNVENAKAAGVDLAFFSGNEMWWRTRWETSIDGSGTSHRTLVCYKESLDGTRTDPTGEWTGTWRDPRFARGAGVTPENALIGQQFRVNGAVTRADAMSVPAEFGKTRLWRNTPVANQATGQTYTFGAGTLGYEWDADTDNGFRPAGLAHLSETTVDVPIGDVLQDDYGVSYAPGRATHNLSLYRDASSGSLVFGAGTVQWSWGLDDEHDGSAQVANTSMRQATVNLFADMGVQPATRASDLVAATASTDTTPPTVTIASTGSASTVGQPVTVSGTATDVGGVVAGVEVSTDAGQTWHPATGRAAWSYTYTPTTSGQTPVQVRAVDDSARLSQPVSRASTVAPRTCPCSIWSTSVVPSVPASDDTAALELGVKFRSSTGGYVTGVRFYKGTGNTGTHTGSLWTSSGQLLATGTFTAESATGWQTLTFATPVEITADTTYVASYWAPAGHYAATSDTFTTRGVQNEPLTALAAGVDGANGVYLAGSSGFPTQSFGSSNYWVDVVFQGTPPADSVAPTATAATPLPGSSSVSRTTTASAVFSESVRASSIAMSVTGAAGSTVAGTVGYDVGTRTATFTPTEQLAAGTQFTVRVTAAQDASGNDLAAPVSWSFTTMRAPAVAGACPCSVWDDTAVPAVVTVSDAAAVELGTRFTPAADGTVTGVRFYKGTQNTGTHTGTLWSADGRALATATFSSESTSGWQQVSFGTPVAVTAGTVYTVSYHTEVGYYSATAGGLNSAVTTGPLTALADGSGGNGVFAYGASTFPSRASGGTNYWVDVVYRPATDTTPPAVASTSPGSGSTSVSVSAAPSATLTELVTGATISLARGSNVVPGTGTYSVSTRTATFTPTRALTAGVTYTATVSGAVDAAGNAMTAPFSWSFTTAGAGSCPCTLFGDTVPTVASADDGGSVELGMRLSSDVDGFVTGVRFYKGTGNTGSHTGSFWSADGTLLAQGTFTGGTASGWQMLTFQTPVPIEAGRTYVASYHAPNGHYTAAADYFGSTLDNAPLHAPASSSAAGNGLYAYGSTVTFPSSSYRAANYFVDAVFTRSAPNDSTPPSVTSTTPVDGASGVSTTSTVQFTFTEPVTTSSTAVTLRAGQQAIAGSTVQTSSRVLEFRPSQPLPTATMVTATVTGVTDVAGNLQAAPVSTSFATAQGALASCPCSLFPATATPDVVAADDDNALELGVRFSSDTDGFVTGIRYYRSSGNTGTHTGTLWAADGTRLATATFTAETASGWQQVLFAQPVAVTAGTAYVASYHMTAGRYSYTAGAFAAAGVDRAPLHVARSTSAAPSSVYTYGASAFPTTGSDTNYHVDVLFSGTAAAAPPADTTAPTVVTTSPAASATAVPLATPLQVTLSEKVAAGSLQMTVTGPNGPVTTVNGLDSTGTVATASPSTPLAGSTVYTVSVRATDLAGNAMPSATTWSFTTADVTPPAVTAATAAGGSASVVVTWTTDEAATSTVQYGTSATVLVSTATGPAGVTAHSVTLTGLASGTAYWYRVVSADAAGNTTTAPAVSAQPATVSTRANLALNGATTTSSSVESAPWGAARAVDGITVSAGSSYGWTSSANTRTDHTETFQVDLGQARSVNEIMLWPRSDAGNVGQGFPAAGTVATSVDGTNWTTVGTISTTQAVTGPQTTTFVNRTARYVRVTGTSLHPIPNDGNQYRMQFAEVGVYGDGSVPDTAVPTVSRVTPAAGSSGAALTVAPEVTFSEPLVPSSVTVTLTGPAGAAVAAAVVVDSTGTKATLTPTSPLAGSTTYTLAARATDLAGNTMAAAASSTFTTVDTTPPTVTAVTPAQGTTGVATGSTFTVVFSEDVAPASLVATVVPAGGAAVPTTLAYTAASRTLTITPSVLLAGSTAHTITVTGAKDTAGNPLAAPYSWSVTTTAASVFGASDTPPTASVTNTTATEVGMRFQTSAAGWVTAVRFYKGTGATGAHVGSLWDSSGTRLATVQFTSETATGWQTATFSRPVQVRPSSVYTVSYTAPAGRWSSTASYFGAAKVSGQLTAFANGSGGNGVTGTPGTRPQTSAAGANLWVDVVFTTSTPPGVGATDTVAPTVTSYGPTGAGQAWIGTAPTFTMSEAVTGAVVTVTGPTGTVVRGTLTYTAATLSGRYALSDVLGLRTTYTVRVSGGRDAAGNTMAPVSWTFTSM